MRDNYHIKTREIPKARPRLTQEVLEERVRVARKGRSEGLSWRKIASGIGITERALTDALKLAGVYPIPIAAPPKLSLYERAHQKYSYDPETGILRHKLGHLAGKIAGCEINGYVHTSVDGKNIPAHRLAWLMHYGVMPARNIDHINRNPSDNRIANLRDVSQSENTQNTTPKRKTGLKGVSPAGSNGRFIAAISHNYKTHFIGTYDSAEDAARAYDREALKRFGDGALTNFKLGAIT